MISAVASWKRPAGLALVGLTVFVAASGVGWLFSRQQYATTQAEVRDLISQLGGHYYYDYQLTSADSLSLADDDNVHSRPHWLAGWLGKDFMHDVFYVSFARFQEFRQDGAVAAQQKEFGDEQLAELLRLEHLRWLALPGTAVTDEGVQAMARLPQLEKVWLSQTRITDASLKTLSRCPHLIHLSVEATPTTDSGIRHIASIRQLQVLSLGSPAITADGLAHLARLELLKELYLDRLRVDQRLLQGLSSHQRLEVLSLRHSPVGDPAINTLNSLSSLTRLLVDGTDISDAALNNPQWPKLVEFSARATRLSDAGLVKLAGCTQLQSLKLEGTSCTLGGIKRLLVDKQGRDWQSALSIVFKTQVDDEGRLISLDTSGFRLRDEDISHLTKFRELRWLVAPGSELTDAGIDALVAANFDELTLLNLNGSEISDRGLHELTKLKSLRNLHVAGTRVSVAQVSDVAKVLPTLRVYTNDLSRSPQY